MMVETILLPEASSVKNGISATCALLQQFSLKCAAMAFML